MRAITKMTSRFRLALIQHAFKGDKNATIEATLGMIANAARNGANLVALQELHTSEYFCQIESVESFKYADDFDAEVERFSNAAKAHKIVLVGSFFEKRTKGLYHNTAVVFERDGSIAGIYRKMHIPDDPQFYEKFYFTPGDLGFTPIQTSLGKIGVLVCWDQWFPEAARIMALKGAEILIYPTAIGFDRNDSDDEKARQLEAWQTIQRAHAVANGVFVAAINRVGFEQCGGNGIEFWGHSFIAGAQGEILAQSRENSDEIISAEIDLARISQVRNIWPFLRDRRIESYDDITKRFIP